MTNTEEYNGLEIAVIGLSGRFPGSKNIDELWHNLRDGKHLIDFFSDEELRNSGVSNDQIDNPRYIKAKGFLEDAEYFDAPFFEYTNKEADYMDPQLRIFHECVYHALEDAGYASEKYPGSIGLFGGAGFNPFWISNFLSTPKSFSELFNVTSLNGREYLTTRVAYKLGLRGPAITVQTACSTSLTAIHLACQSLISGECEVAMAGGVTVLFPEMGLPRKYGMLHEDGLIISPDGHCKPFDKEANGFMGGDGVGVVALKRLEDALKDNDNIYAVVKGSAVNNDGRAKTGYTAPSVDGQSRVIETALNMSGVDARSIGYIETHGSGTPLGDAVEIASLKQVFDLPKGDHCAIGSIKSNMGHLDAAAGVAGFIKTVLALKNKEIPAIINHTQANPDIDFDNSPFYVNKQLRPWEKNGTPRRAGVSSFGIGGSNAHIVLEEAPVLPPTQETKKQSLVLLSAKTESALNNYSESLHQFLIKHKDVVSLRDLAYTLQVGRSSFEFKRSFICSDIEDLLSQMVSGKNSPKVSRSKKGDLKSVVFVFSGLGGQYVNMGRDIYESEPCFEDAMDRVFLMVSELTDIDLKSNIYPDAANQKDLEGLAQFDIGQLSVFAFEYAMANLLLEWGISPNALIGYSFGEYTAACISGILSLDDTLKIIIKRGELSMSCKEGAMLNVPLERDELLPHLGDGLELAIDNGESCVVAGKPEDIDALQDHLKSSRVMCMYLPAKRAIHSSMMEPCLPEFEKFLEEITFSRNDIPLVSNVTGTWVDQEICTPKYWLDHLSRTVEFAKGIGTLSELPNCIYVEVGPGSDITSMLQKFIEPNPQSVGINTCRPESINISDTKLLLSRLRKLWQMSVDISWEGLYSDENRKRISLPGYVFDKHRYWFKDGELTSPESGKVESKTDTNSDLVKNTNISEWLNVPSWEQSSSAAMNEFEGIYSWLVFADDSVLSTTLTKDLKAAGQSVVTVKLGEKFERTGRDDYTLNPMQDHQCDDLANHLFKDGLLPDKIVHLWNRNHQDFRNISEEEIDKSVANGFHCLSGMARALHFIERSKPVKFFVITSGLHSVLGTEKLSPVHANILGASRVLPFEFDNIDCVNIDVEHNPSDEGQLAIEQVRCELMQGSIDQVIAFRGRKRWVLGYKPYRVKKDPAQLSQLLKKNNVYVIVGGLCTASNLGFTLANFLAKEAGAHIVLLSRTVYPPRDQWPEILEKGEDTSLKNKIGQILRIETNGGKVHSLSSDLTDLDRLQKSIEHVEEHIGPINGVINVSGVNLGKSVLIINDATRDELKAQFDIKVNGTINLMRALNGRALDFCILSSSLSAIMGPFAAYAAGNSCIDAIANAANQEGSSPWLSVNWDHLLGVDEMSEQVLAINHEEIVDVFKRIILLRDVGQIVVSSASIEGRMEKAYGPRVTENTDFDIRNGLSKWYYKPAWVEREPSLKSRPGSKIEGALIFTEESKLNKILQEKIEQISEHSIIIFRGDKFEKNGRTFTIEPSRPEHYEQLFLALKRDGFTVNKLFHLWNSQDHVAEPTLRDATVMQDIGFYSLLNIAKYLSDIQANQNVVIGIVTNNMLNVSGEEELSSLKATMLGPIKIIPEESGRLRCINIDVDINEFQDLPDQSLDNLAHDIINEFNQDVQNHLLIANRGGKYYIPTYTTLQDDTLKKVQSSYKEEGVYLLTGGTGGMALEIVNHISQEVRGSFILLDNGKFPLKESWDDALLNEETGDNIKEKITTLMAVEQRGSRIEIYPVDVTDQPAMTELMSDIYSRYESVNGVFHIAGMIDHAGMIQTRSLEETQKVIGPKVEGTLILDDVLSEQSLDFIMYFSSTGNVFSRLKFGQVAYNAGHEFIDSYAHHRRKNGFPAFVVNWNDWHNTGISGEAAKNHDFKIQGSDISFTKLLSIKPVEGLVCLDHILAANHPQTIVSAFDLLDVLNFVDNINASDVAHNSSEDSSSLSKEERPELSTEYVAPQGQRQMDLAEIFRGIFGINQIGIDDDFFELGGDSIKAISAISLLQRHHGLDLPVTTFFKARTIRNICGHLSSEGETTETKAVSTPQTSEDAKEFFEPFPLTPIQMAYFMGRRDHFDMGGISTNVYQEGEVSVDLAILNTTFNRIIQRHPMLRAIFLPDGTQKFIEVDGYKIDNKDLRNLSEEEQQKLIHQNRERLNNHVFQETEWPLFEISTFTLSDTKSYIFFCLDHIICDAHSILLFVKEWDALLRNPSKVLPQLNYTFKDYILEYESLKESEKYRVSKEYWMGQLDHFPLAPSLPYKCEPATVKKPKFKRQHRLFSKQDWETLQSISKAHSTTPSVILSAAYARVLAVWSGRDQVSINLTLFNRYPFHDDVPNIVGDFTMLLMLGLKFGANQDFLEDVAKVQNTMLESLDNRFYDGVDFIREFRKRHNLGVQAVMPYVFTSALFANELTDPDEVEVLNFWRVQRDAGMASSQSSQVYLDCTASEMNGGLELVWDYVDDIFDDRMINMMFDQFISIIQNTLKGQNKLDAYEENQKALQFLNVNDAQLTEVGNKSYWLQQFSDGVPALDLPTSFSRRNGAPYVEKRQHFEIDGSIAAQLREVLEERDVEMSGFLMATFIIFISKVVGHDKILIGSSTIGSGPNDKIMDLTHPIAHLSEPSPDKTVSAFVSEIIENGKSNWMHRAYAFGDVLNALQIPANSSEGPLFDVLFNMCHVEDDVWKAPILSKLEPDVKKELSFILVESKDDMVVAIDYDTALFSERRVADLFSYYVTTLRAVLKDGNSRLADISILPDLENDKVIFGFNKTQSPYATDMLIHELFEKQSATNPEHVALVYAGKFVTYDELNRKANQLAHQLKSLGVTKNANVGVIQNRSDDLIVTLLGIMKAGAVYVPLEPYLPGKRIQTILSTVGCDTIVIDDTQVGMIKSITPGLKALRNIVTINEETDSSLLTGTIEATFGKSQLAKLPVHNPDPVATPLDNAYIIFTSGTTGDPKGVVVQHQPVINLIEWVTKTYNFSSTDRVLFTTSVSFDLSVFDIFGLLAVGGSVFVLSSTDVQDPAIIARELVNNDITFWDSAPQAFQQVISYMQHESPSGDYSDLRLSFSSGDWVPLQLPENIKTFFKNCHVVALGGATEATVWSNYFDVHEVLDEWVSIPYGKPIQNSKYYILDDGLNACPIGTPGYLYIGGECLAREYYGDDALTERKFIENPFCNGEKMYFTGDRARWFEDGNIEFLGRLDDQVKVRGYRVELGEIESHLLGHPAVKEGVVIAKKHEGNNYLVAYIVATSKIDTNELRELLLTHLPDYMVPYYYVELDQLPLTTNGKLNKKMLPEPQLGSDREHIPPSTNVEKKLARIWANLLSLQEDMIGITDGFFELGGHSLKATLLINKISQEFSVNMPLTEIFSKDTIRHQAQFIDTQNWLNAEDKFAGASGKSEVVI